MKAGKLIGGCSGSRGLNESGLCRSEIESVSRKLDGSLSETVCGWLIFTCTFAGLIAELGSHDGSHGDNSPLVELPLVVDLCPSLPGRQFTQVFLAFTQAQPLQ